MVRCSSCGAELAEGSDVCGACGHAVNQTSRDESGASPDTVDVQQSTCPQCNAPLGPDQKYCKNCWTAPETAPNDSGQHAGVPQEIAAFKWHWGAFLLNWLWMLNHGLIALGVVTILIIIAKSVLPFAAIVQSPSSANVAVFFAISIVGSIVVLGLAIYAGINGHKLAWRYRRFAGGVKEYMSVQQAWHNWGLGLLAAWVLVIPFIAILAAILFPVFSNARSKARSISSQSNLKQIGLATLQYSADYDDTLPPMDTYNHFKSALYPYAKTDAIWLEPGINAPYDLMSEMSCKKIKTITYPASTVLMQESKPVYSNQIAKLYADFHVSVVKNPQDDAGGPSPKSTLP